MLHEAPDSLKDFVLSICISLTLLIASGLIIAAIWSSL